MEIHELPTDTPTAADFLAMDDGTSSRKTPFSGFEAGQNPVTFVNRDTAEPTSWAGFSVIESGSTLATILNRVSAAVANVRYLRTFLGTSSISELGTTITGAINALFYNVIGTAPMGTTSGTVKAAIRELATTIGTIQRANSQVDLTIPNETYSPVIQITLPAGSWLLTGKVRFSTGTTGVRRLNFSTTAGGTGWTVSHPAANAIEDIQVVTMLTLTEETTYYLNAWQNSGASLTCPSGQAQIRAARIGL